jgi:hypothetical protein
MGISQAASAVMVFLAGLLPASCHKTATPTSTPPPAATTNTAGVKILNRNLASTPPPAATTNTAGVKILNRNLGELSLTNHNDLFVQFDNGEICTLTPKLLAKGNVCITVSLETRNDLGETHDINVKQITTKAGTPVEVAVGDLTLSFTPKVAKEE